MWPKMFTRDMQSKMSTNMQCLGLGAENWVQLDVIEKKMVSKWPHILGHMTRSRSYDFPYMADVQPRDPKQVLLNMEY